MNIFIVIVALIGLGQKILTQVGSIFCCLGSGHPSLVWAWEIAPKDLKFFNFCLSGQKNIFQWSGPISTLWSAEFLNGDGGGLSFFSFTGI